MYNKDFTYHRGWQQDIGQRTQDLQQRRAPTRHPRRPQHWVRGGGHIRRARGRSGVNGVGGVRGVGGGVQVARGLQGGGGDPVSKVP